MFVSKHKTKKKAPAAEPSHGSAAGAFFLSLQFIV